MSYIGNTSTVQQYAPQVAYFSGNASTVAFTLPVSVVSAAQIIVTVANVIQNPSSSFTVNGTTLTFTSAPPSGTNNIWVQYTTLQTNIVVPAAASVGLTQLSATGTPSSSNYLRGDNSWASLTSSQWTTSSSDIYYTAGKVLLGGKTVSDSASYIQIRQSNAIVAGSTYNWNGSDKGILLQNSSSTTGAGVGITMWMGSSNNAVAAITGVQEAADSTGALAFFTGGAGTSNTVPERVRIDSSGRVTKPYQPAFFAYRSVTFAGTSQVPFQFTDVDLNIGGHYSNSTYRFTAPVAGRYYFSSALAVYLNGNARQVSMGIRKNGSLYCMSDCHITQSQSNNTHGVANLNIVMELAASDYVDVQWEGATATVNVYVDSRRTYFTGYLLG